ncbi:MAG: diphthine--ammonia ligase [bacterium]
MKEKVIFSWSGGKDSSLALYEIQKIGNYEIIALLTTISETYDRVSMHGVRQDLLEKQVESLNLPIHKIPLSLLATNEEYETKMEETLLQYKKEGVKSVVFGDIFLEELKKYRENNLAKIDMKAIFPIWKQDTKEVSRKFINLGFKSIVTCIDTKVLDESFAGRLIDENFLNELPKNVDPCGENGEFHSFAFDGPIFKKKIGFSIGEKVLRDHFYFCDLY